MAGSVDRSTVLGTITKTKNGALFAAPHRASDDFIPVSRKEAARKLLHMLFRRGAHRTRSPPCGQERSSMLRPSADTRPLVAISVLLQQLHDEIPADRFTLGWLMHGLHKRSFGIIMLLLALVAIAPGLSILAGLLLMIPAFQMIMGKPAPVFPHRIAMHSLPTRYLAAVLQRSVPVRRYLENVVHPRWHTPLELTKRTVGVAVLVLS